jgi:hypothetical protein
MLVIQVIGGSEAILWQLSRKAEIIRPASGVDRHSLNSFNKLPVAIPFKGTLYRKYTGKIHVLK